MDDDDIIFSCKKYYLTQHGMEISLLLDTTQ